MEDHPQDQTLTASLTDPESFWHTQAQKLVWTKPYSRVLDHDKKTGKWAWFPDGELSCCYNCVDRHVDEGNGDVDAIIWDSAVTKTVKKITYRELQEEVMIFAEVLKDMGVQRGDTVLIYMPMIPEVVIGMLACNRLGAIHSVVFGGFAAAETTKRIDSCSPRVILAASCGIEGAKGPQHYKPLIDAAIEAAESSNRPQCVLYFKRPELWVKTDKARGEYDWARLCKERRQLRRMMKECVSTNSNDSQYIIYTSGTTGMPKGVVRDVGGHAVGLRYSIEYLFGLKPKDVIFTASDVGWVVGHSFCVYAPLLAGCTTVIFEGKPVGTPGPGTFWRVVEQHKVNVLFTAPTALRAIKREDPELKEMSKRNLKSLRALFLAGERSEPNIVQSFQDLLTEHCADGAQVVDNWWSSESGSPITGLAMNPVDRTTGVVATPLNIKPGSAGKPMPGWNVKVVDDAGKEVAQGSMGNIVLQLPLAPTGFRRLWGHDGEDRFWKGYLKRFNGKYIDTGDAGMIDQDAYVHVMSRSDDIINVAAHRFSTSSIEQAVTTHSAIAECAVIGMPDELKGHVPFAFCTLAINTGHHVPSAEELFKEANQRVRSQIGAIASLGGLICGVGIIPKTRSGKTLRRVLRELVENGAKGEFKDVTVPPTVEDISVVTAAKEAVRQYFEGKGNGAKAMEFKAKL